jgi:hypothetical protein
MARLRDDEVEHYRREGWVVPRWHLPPARVAAMVEALEDLLRRNPGVRPEKLVSAHIEGMDGRGDNGEGVRGSRAFLDLARDPEIVELVSGVIGEDVILWGCHVFCKPAVEGYETPWHQDGHYWPIRPLATCTAWVALEPSTVENGCLRVIPRSHRAGKFPHRETYATDNLSNHGEEIDVPIDESRAADVTLRPGEMSVHHVNAIHGSCPNASSYARIGFSASYTSPDVPAGGMRVVRVRGEIDRVEPPADDIRAGIASHAAYVRSHGRGLRLGP